MWTPEDIDALITTVRNHEELYDQRNPSYSNREVIDQIWHRIAVQLNKSDKECSKKWQLLRAGYRKRRHLFDAPSGSGAKKIKKWAYFDSLSFLQMHMVERPTMTNISQLESSSSRSNVTDSEGILEFIHSDDETPNSRINTVQDSMESQEKVERRYDISDEECSEEVNPQNELLQAKTPPMRTLTIKRKQKDDVDKEFFNYLKAASARKKVVKEKSSMELFLLSCVDEANALSLPAQRIFKRRVIDSLSELSNDPYP